jgi:hypothetical protein
MLVYSSKVAVAGVIGRHERAIREALDAVAGG